MSETTERFRVHWYDHGREPQCAPDPAFPNGRDLDMTAGAHQTCQTALPYPAKRCGLYLIACNKCGKQTLVTTAGRRDDPRSVRIACKKLKR